MKLRLDQTQRLNLHALMGAQRGSVDDVRLWWRLQDMIWLSEEELKEINYRIVVAGEVEQPRWDLNKHIAVRDYELTNDEFKRIEKILKEWQPGFVASGDRRWLEPLLAQFEQRVNGSASDEASVYARHSA